MHGAAESSPTGHVVFVDESGDHGLARIDPAYPVFVLAFCVLQVADYVDRVTPGMRHLKFPLFGHDLVVLHERDIRKRLGAFRHLPLSDRESLLRGLTRVIAATPLRVVAVVIDKRGRLSGMTHPYHLAMRIGIRRVRSLVSEGSVAGTRTCVICEARGATEDRALRDAFERHHARRADPGETRFELLIADKRTNSEGLQLCDLVARPFGLKVLHPDQDNRAWDVLSSKLGPEPARVRRRGAVTVFG